MLLNHWLSFFTRNSTRRAKVARGLKRSRQLCAQPMETRLVLTTWTGATSSDWNDPTNWSAGVPTTGSTVILPQGAKNMGITKVTSANLNTLDIQDPGYTLAALNVNTDLGFRVLNLQGNFGFTFAFDVTIENQGGQNASINMSPVTGTTLTFNGRVNVSGAPDLTINNNQDTVIFNSSPNGTFGSVTNDTFGNITFGRVINTNFSDISSTGNQEYASALTLTAPNTASFDSANGDINFFYSVDGNTKVDVTAGGTVRFGAGTSSTINQFNPLGTAVADRIGAITQLVLLDVSANAIDMNFAQNGTSINTLQDQTFDANNITIGNNFIDSVFQGGRKQDTITLSGRNVSFGGTNTGKLDGEGGSINSSAQLVVNTDATANPDGTPGRTTFNGEVGASNPLISMTLNPNNPGAVGKVLGLTQIFTDVVNTYAFQTYNSPVTFISPSNLLTVSAQDGGWSYTATNANGISSDISFNSTLDSGYDPLSKGIIGNPQSLIVNTAEPSPLDTNPLHWANVNFGDAINQDYVGNISILDSLVVQVTSGNTADGDVNFTQFDVLNPTILTQESQTYSMNVALKSAALFRSSDDFLTGNITFNQLIDAESSTAAINSPQTMVVATDATTTFNGEIGSRLPVLLPTTPTTKINYQPLLHLTVQGSGGNLDNGNPALFGDPTLGTTVFNIPPDTDIVGNLLTPSVTTSGGMSFFNAVQLAQDTTFFSNTKGPIGVGNATNGNIQFLNTIDTAPATGPTKLDINTLGTTQFGSGLTIYPQHLVPLSQGIGFVSPLQSVTVNDAIGYGLAPNGANSILTAQGQTLIQYNLSADPNNPTITTIGDQTYYNPVILGLNTVLKSTSAGNMLFASQVNSQSSATPSALTVNTGTVAGVVAGTVTFGFTTTTTSNTGSENVGTVNPLQSLNITTAKTFLNVHASTDAAPTIATLTDQNYNTHTFVGQNAVLTSRQTGNVTFNGMIDSTNGNPQSLIVNTTGNELFTQAVGSQNILSALTTDDDKTVGIGGAAIFTAGSTPLVATVRTTGTQTFNDNVILGGNSVFTTVASGNVVFANTINSQSSVTPSALTVNSAGNTDFGTGQNGSNVGTKVPLLSVTTDAPGFTRFNVPGSTNTNPSVQTIGSQTYNDPVILLNNTVLSSTTGSAITLASVRGAPPFVLTINPNPTAVNALAGFYTVNTPNAPTPGPIAQVIQDGNNLTFIDPNNLVTTGSVTSPTTITGRNGLTGTLTPDRIAWSDGTFWNKIDLSGTYIINNHPTPTGQITQVGTTLTFINPFNPVQQTQGQQTAFNAVVDSGNGDSGQVVFNANGSVNEIVFSNGDVWVRSTNGTSSNAPTVTLPSGPISYTPNTGAVILDPNATVTDPDSLNFSTGNLTVVVAQNGTAGDVLGIHNQGNGAGQISVSGNNVFFGGVLIGTITGSGNGASTPLVVTFNNNATPAAAQALLRNITFATTDGTSVAARQIQVTVTDNTGLVSNPAFTTVNVGASQPPVISVSGGTSTYSLNNPAQIIDSNIQVTDPDSPTFNNGTVTVSLVGGGTVNDVLSIRNQGMLLGQIGVVGNTVYYSGSAIGTFSGGTNLLPLQFSLNSNATPAAVQALLQNITFNTVGPNATTGVRTVQFQMTDGTGGISIPVTDGINVVPVSGAQPPVITLPSGPVTYKHNKAAVTVDPLALVSDVNLTSFPGGTLHVQIAGASKQDHLKIHSVGNKPGQISFANGHVKYGGKVIATFSGNWRDAVFTFNSNATTAAVQALVRSIQFYTQGVKTPLGPRQVQFQMSDGQGNTSTLVSTQVNVI